MIRAKRLLVAQTGNDSWVTFTNGDDWGAANTRITISAEDFRAMGSPDEITVTIEPGDTLNNHPKGAL